MNTRNSEDRRPLYLQVHDILHARITSGEYPPGVYLPTENELVESFNVSRITIRKALELLSQEKLISKKKGVGSFVLAPADNSPLGATVHFIRDMLPFGRRPSSTMLRNVLVHADSYIAKRMGIPEDTEMACVVRLRYADDEPLFLEMSYLLHERCPGILEQDFSTASLRKYLIENHDIVFKSATQEIRAIAASPEIAPLLNMKRGEPVLYIERTITCQDDKPVEFLMAYHRGDHYFITTRLEY